MEESSNGAHQHNIALRENKIIQFTLFPFLLPPWFLARSRVPLNMQQRRRRQWCDADKKDECSHTSMVLKYLRTPLKRDSHLIDIIWMK